MPFRPKPGVVVETTEFNGYTYRRYPNSPNPAHKRYFGRAGHRLHRDVWIYFNGKIPSGYQIHHIDGDAGNNNIANLECIPFKKHREKHAEEYISRGKSEKQISHLAVIREKAKEWHRSDEGRAWHRQHVFTSMRAEDKPKPYSKSHYTGVCEWCGSPFEAKSPKKTTCSIRCVERKSKFVCGKISKAHPYYASRIQSDS